MCRVCYFSLFATLGNITNVCPFQNQKDVHGTSSALNDRPASIDQVNAAW